jgi:hypothetical protein
MNELARPPELVYYQTDDGETRMKLLSGNGPTA